MPKNRTEQRDLIAVLPKNKQEEVQVAVEEFMGRLYLDIRIYVGGYPSPKGIKVKPKYGKQLRRAIKKAENYVRQLEEKAAR